MIKVSTFLQECLDEIEMKKYLPPYDRELTSFLPCSSESLCSVDGTPTRCPMLQQGLKCFKQKIKINKNLVGSSVAFQSPRPHGGAAVHDGFVGGGGGLKFF
jgi:hypothetical protein